MPKRNKSAGPAEPTSGRDEMNLAEFPISLLTNREPEGRGPLVFEGRYGRLTISGSGGPREQGNGLPTASDTDVLIGLLQLTKRANDFTEPTVAFSRYELLKIIRWPDEGKSYRRLAASLNRWTGVKLHYEKSWYDNLRKRRVDAIFHILESVIIFDRAAHPLAAGLESDEPPSSSFSWNKLFFRSCQAGNLKRLDLDVYFSLGSPASKQLYRFLDKHFYEHEVLTFELRELAVSHIGLSANYTIPRIKEKLAPCLEELERIGFIEPATKAHRYAKTGHGRWDIVFERRAAPKEGEPETSPGISPGPELPSVRQLVARGVTAATARGLARDFPAEVVDLKLEVFDWLTEKRDKRISRNPAGYLAKSIRDDFATPKGFKCRARIEAERLATEEAERKHRSEREMARRKEEREGAERAAVEAHLASLDAAQRAALEHEASAQSGLNPRLFGRLLVRDHVRRILGFAEPPC